MQLQPMSVFEPKIIETNDVKASAVSHDKSFTIKSISPAVVKFIDDSEISDDYCE